MRKWLSEPPVGSAARPARHFGIDLSLNAHRLSLLAGDRIGFHTVFLALNKYRVRYAAIGGVAMQFHASAIMTRDLDIAYARDTENVKRLAKALAPFRPKLRGADKYVPFRFDERTLSRA